MKDETATPDQRQADAALMAVAVRNVLRAAEAVAALGTDADLDAALATFRAKLPGVKDLRDVLEHFDAYASNHGRLQRAGEAPGGYRVFYERPVLRYMLHVGDLVLDVDDAAEAAGDLTEVTLGAIKKIVAAEAPETKLQDGHRLSSDP
jgi:hypothetical protein